MPRRCTLPLLRCLSAVLTAGLLLVAGCDKLKKAPPPKPKGAIPEIVDTPAEPAPPPVAVPVAEALPELTVNKSAQVSILGYHDFVTGRARNDMEINADHFRRQMQALKDGRISVISMADFLQWKAGEKDVPDPCVVITIDDGWKSVHTLALPVLREFGYPFTVFLYKNFVNGGGRALTTSEIRDIMAAKGEIGSHSVSHPLPAQFREYERRGPDAIEAFRASQLRDSKQFLEDLLMVKVTTYAYPGGFYKTRDQELAVEYGYVAAFTCNPVKVDWETPAMEIPRFIVRGDEENDRVFKMAVASRGAGETDLVKQLLAPDGSSEALVTTSPAPNSTTPDRRPLIEVDVSKLPGIDPASVTMTVAGFGKVPAEFDPEAGRIRYRLKEPLRNKDCQVYVRFRRPSEDKADEVSWKFFVDLLAHYLPETDKHTEKATPVAE